MYVLPSMAWIFAKADADPARAFKRLSSKVFKKTVLDSVGRKRPRIAWRNEIFRRKSGKNVYRSALTPGSSFQDSFIAFLLHQRAWSFFRVTVDNELLEYGRCPFGCKLCPYYCSTWTAEIKQWLEHQVLIQPTWVTTGSPQDEPNNN